MEDDPDRRIRRTRRLLEEALVRLISTRPYTSIQVRDITDAADIGYATFYRHYDSKDNLMLAVFDRIMSELEASAAEPDDNYFEQEGRLIFGHVQKHTGLYRGVLHSLDFVTKLKKLLAGRVQEHLQRHTLPHHEPAIPLDLAAHHMASAVIGLIEWWLDTGLRLPVDAMAHIYRRLVIEATLAAQSDDPSPEDL